MAELEILNWLVGIFCPTSEAASTCNEFISSHSNVLPPIGPIFYFLLFPAVFTILFILVLMRSVKVAEGNWGMQVLLGVTAFIFIIISGWYPVMLILSEFWYIIIILFGFWWFLKGHFGKKEGGGGKGPMSALGFGGAMEGLGGQLFERGMKEATGERKRLERRVDLALVEMEKLVKILHNKPESWRAYSAEIENCRNLITQYYNIVSVGKVPVGGDAAKKIERLETILSKIDREKS